MLFKYKSDGYRCCLAAPSFPGQERKSSGREETVLVQIKMLSRRKGAAEEYPRLASS